jgi:hypothetical protein
VAWSSSHIEESRILWNNLLYIRRFHPSGRCEAG